MTFSDLRYDGAPARRAHILSRLRSAGFLSIVELTRALGVSHMTIRRDLNQLQAAGVLRIVHGGASLTPQGLAGPPFRDDGRAEARSRVAEAAATLVERRDTIALDAGPTAYALAHALPATFEGTVITHSVPVLQRFAMQATAARVVALGGELRADRLAFVGPATEAAAAQLRARTFFLSPTAVDARGLYAATPAEASVQRGLIEIADRVVLVVTDEVFAASAPALVAPLRRVTCAVVERAPPPALAAALGRAAVPTDVVSNNGRP
jgi:DeoR/GlpR family transcriptional regulator of sugar metabolism